MAEIGACIGKDSIVNAGRFIAGIRRQCRALARSPGMGRARPEIGKGVRSFPVGRYLVFYRLVGDGIEVFRAIHGARDLKTVFPE